MASANDDDEETYLLYYSQSSPYLRHPQAVQQAGTSSANLIFRAPILNSVGPTIFFKTIDE